MNAIHVLKRPILISFRILRTYSNHLAFWAVVMVGSMGVLQAQNASYGSNALPISGTDNAAFGAATMNNTNTGQRNVAVGKESLRALTFGAENIGVGYRALRLNTTGGSNTALGGYALYSNVGGSGATAVGWGAMQYANNQANSFTNQNVAVGREALRGSTTAGNNTGNYNTGLGYRALYLNASGQYNTAMGSQSLAANTAGGSNTALGFNSMLNNTTGGQNTATGSASLRANTSGVYNSAFGYLALPLNTTGQFNTAVGNNALEQTTTGNNNTAIGASSFQNQTGGSNCTALGAFTTASNNISNATAIGFGANVTAGNTIQLGNGSVTKVVAGTGTTATFVTGRIQVLGGSPGTGKVLTSDATGLATWQTPIAASAWLIGGNTAGATDFIGTNNPQDLRFKVWGTHAGRIDAGATSGTLLGYRAGMALTSTGINNSAFGREALRFSTTGTNNTAIGMSVLLANTSGSYNTGTGKDALRNNMIGAGNTADGSSALYFNTTGANNTAVGYNSLYTNNTGSCNTALGYFANVQSSALTNATAIGCSAVVSSSNAMQLGNNLVTKVNIGVGNAATLITGGIQVTGGAPGTGKVLTSNATGVATWQNPNTGNDWSLSGNAGTTASNFIGTTDNMPLNFRVQNQPAGRIEPASTTANTFLGYLSGVANTGINNSGFGYLALNTNSSGNLNSAFGSSSLKSNTTGYSNTATGHRSLEANETGYGNTAMGSGVMSQSFSGSGNAAFGYRTMTSNFDGSDNSAFGGGALGLNMSGSCNTALGRNANVSTGALSNATAIGCGSIVNASDKIRLGDANIITIESSVFTATTSDGRFKTNIREDDIVGLAFIQKLRPVVYNFDTRRFTQFLTKNMPDSLAAHYLADDFGPSTAIRQSGFIAQEVEQAAKEVGYDFNGVHVPADENDNYSLAYAQFVVPLVKGMQEQQAMIESQQAQIAELQTLVRTLTQTCCPGSSGVPAQGGTKADTPATGSASEPAAPAHPAEVFPNPSEGRFTLRIAPLEQGHYEVFDQHGQPILRQALTAGQTEYTIDLSGQAVGSYLLRLHSHCGIVATKQLVVQ